MNRNKILLILSVFIVVFAAGLFLFFNNKNSKEGQSNDTAYKDLKQILGDQVLAQKMRETEISQDNEKREVKGVQRGVMMSEAVYTRTAALSDVTGGDAAGIVKTGYDNGSFNLSASFAGLSEPQDGNYYEGWLIRTEPFSFISTGRVEKLGGVYNNLYKSEKDLMNYDFYVLTIEADDGDPAPGVHILEGSLINN